MVLTDSFIFTSLIPWLEKAISVVSRVSIKRQVKRWHFEGHRPRSFRETEIHEEM